VTKESSSSSSAELCPVDCRHDFDHARESDGRLERRFALDPALDRRDRFHLGFGRALDRECRAGRRGRDVGLGISLGR
jgi:hypothetical protein